MTGLRPVPKHPEYRSIDSGEDPLGDDMAVVVCPSLYDRIYPINKKMGSSTQVLSNGLAREKDGRKSAELLALLRAVMREDQEEIRVRTAFLANNYSLVGSGSESQRFCGFTTAC